MMKNVIFIADDWGYTKGGINTINMELCKAIAELNRKDINIFCIVIFSDQKIIEEVSKMNLKLISLYNKQPERSCYDETHAAMIIEKLEESSIFFENLTWIVGHDVITGQIAIDLKKHLEEQKKLAKCFSAIIHHMEYEDYLVNKASYDGSKIMNQRELLKKADILFGVGPRLQRSACDIKQNKQCPMIIPGINSPNKEISQYEERDPFKVIVCGRIGTKDDIIKNAILAVKAWASSVNSDDRLVQSRINLIGCDEDQKEELIKIGSKYAGRRVSINPFGFMDHDKLIREMVDHRLCIMPSLKEGFGLTGLEAISLGVPVILSRASGLFELLNNKVPYSAYISSIDIHGGEENEEKDIPVLKRTILEIYNNYPTYKNNAVELRKLLIKDSMTWENAALQFLGDLRLTKEINSITPCENLSSVTYFNTDVFTDRSDILNNIFHCIDEGKLIVNLFGKKGIGKSSILRFFSDGINGTFSVANRHKTNYFNPYKKLIDQINIHFIELSCQGGLKKALCVNPPFLNENEPNFFVHYIQTLRINNGKKYNLLILDNANEGLNEELFELYSAFSNSNINNFCLIIGSVKELPFSYLSSSLHQSLDITPFEQKEIKEYALNNKMKTDDNLVKNIEKISRGLPIYIKLLLKRSVNCQGMIGYRDMEKYLEDLLKDIKKENNECYELVLYVAFLSIHESYGLSVNTLQKSLQIIDIYGCIDKLENHYSLIEHNRGSRCLKMHDVLRDIIVKLMLDENTTKVREILNDLDKEDKRQRSYYILLLETRYQTTEDENNEIITAIHEAVEKDDYTYLLSLGEHFRNIHFLNGYESINNDLYRYVIWGFLEGYIGIGNYPDAREIVDTCKISVRNPCSEIHLNLSLTIAKLYHLQNNYQEAIATYQIIFESMNQDKLLKKHQTTCLWGIAHSYRHEGKDLCLAFKSYDNAIKIAIEANTRSDRFKCEIEKIAILDYWGQFEESDKILSIIKKELCELPKDEYFGTRISVRKAEARHLRIAEKENSTDAYMLLTNVLDDYKKIKKRLQYNTLFELGEYYRSQEDYDNAFDKYQQALIFSKKNRDKNLFTMCLLGILLCEISTGEIFRDDGIPQKDLLKEIISECDTYNLYINKLLASLLHDFIVNGKVDYSLIQSFKEIGCYKEVEICENLNTNYIKKINLTLM